MSVGSVGGVGASGGGAAAPSAPASGGAPGVGGAGGVESAGSVAPKDDGQSPLEGAQNSSMQSASSNSSCNMSTQNFVQLHNMGETQGAAPSQSAVDPEMMKKILEMMMVMAVLDALQQM